MVHPLAQQHRVIVKVTGHKIQVQHKKHRTISVSVASFHNKNRAYKVEMSDKMDLSTCDILELIDIADAFKMAVLKSKAFEQQSNIKVGFLGASQSGKSTFSNGFQQSLKHNYSCTEITHDIYNQFHYKSANYMSVQRADMAAMTDSQLETMNFSDKKYLYLIEHPDLKKSLQCHVLVGLKSPTHRQVTREHLDLGRDLIAEANDLNEIAPENSRHIQIAYQDSYFNRQVFETALEQIMQQPLGHRLDVDHFYL